VKEEDLKIYSDGVVNYFKQFAESKVVLNAPALKSDNFTFFDYSAIIGISGAVKGGIYITVSTAMLDDLIVAMGMGAPDDSLRRDMIGEVANNISGNAGDKFSGEFKISVPIVVTGKDHNIQLPVKIPAYAVPFEWKGHKSQFVVGTE